MTRTEFLDIMKAYAEELTSEQKEMKGMMKMQPYNSELYYKESKIGHEISALNNAIREMERK